MLVKTFRIELFNFPMDTHNLLIWAISGLIAVENDSELLLAVAVLNDLVPMTE